MAALSPARFTEYEPAAAGPLVWPGLAAELGFWNPPVEVVDPWLLLTGPIAEARPAQLRCAPLDDNQRCVSTPDGRLLAAKSERVRLPNMSPNYE
jgi:hypothetical protein